MDDVTKNIKNTINRARRNDFLWIITISFTVTLIAILVGTLNWTHAAIFQISFFAIFALRYHLSTERIWIKPIQNIVTAKVDNQESELSSLRLARKVAQVLPDPLFIIQANGIIESTNPAAKTFLNRQDTDGRHLATVLRSAPVFDMVETVAHDKKSRTVEFATTGSVKRFCRAYLAVIDDKNEDSRILLFIRDLTSEHRVEQMRVDFIASASHELRTPLASLIGFIETLRGPASEDREATTKFLKIMQKQAERMQRLVADLMSLSRIELNEHVAPTTPIHLGEIIDDVVEELRPMLERTEAMVETAHHAKTSQIMILGERDEILQAAQNLVHNAIKYGGDPARVNIAIGRGEAPSLSPQNDASLRAGDSAGQVAARLNIPVEDLAYIQIRDFGPGIERADLPRLTERFYRVNIERSRNTSGTGLGLAIVKHIINRHKGGLQIESRLASGTAFTCYFANVTVGASVNTV